MEGSQRLREEGEDSAWWKENWKAKFEEGSTSSMTTWSRRSMMLTTFKTFSTGLKTSYSTSWRDLKRNESMRVRRQVSRDPWDSFGNLLVRAIFIGLGLVFLEQYRFQDLFGSILGLTF